MLCEYQVCICCNAYVMSENIFSIGAHYLLARDHCGSIIYCLRLISFFIYKSKVFKREYMHTFKNVTSKSDITNRRKISVLKAIVCSIRTSENIKILLEHVSIQTNCLWRLIKNYICICIYVQCAEKQFFKKLSL